MESYIYGKTYMIMDWRRRGWANRFDFWFGGGKVVEGGNAVLQNLQYGKLWQ